MKNNLSELFPNLLQNMQFFSTFLTSYWSFAKLLIFAKRYPAHLHHPDVSSNPIIATSSHISFYPPPPPPPPNYPTPSLLPLYLFLSTLLSPNLPPVPAIPYSSFQDHYEAKLCILCIVSGIQNRFWNPLTNNKTCV